MNNRKKIKFGLLQYKLTSNPLTNLSVAFDLLGKIARKKPHFVVLPEMWLGGPTQKSQRDAWGSFYQKTFPKITTWSRIHKIGLFFSQLEVYRKNYYNTAYFIDPTGKIKGKYKKIHLFRFEGETKIYSAGKEVKTFSSAFGKLGCVVCFDIRFPELIRKLANQNAKLLVVCAQWPQARIQHWLTLLKARAIENQFFVVACNRVGTKGKIRYNGHSVIISPWGDEILHLSPNQQMGVAEIDLANVDKSRTKYPFFVERKVR